MAAPEKKDAQASLPRTISWQGLEFEYTPKGSTWNALVIGITGIFFIWGLLSKSFTGSLLALLAGFTFFVYSHKHPKEITFTLKPTGIQIGRHVHHYSELTSFWIHYHPPHVKEISIHSKKILEPKIHIPLYGQNPVVVRQYLAQYLAEDEHDYSIIDGIMRAIGF